MPQKKMQKISLVLMFVRKIMNMLMVHVFVRNEQNVIQVLSVENLRMLLGIGENLLNGVRRLTERVLLLMITVCL